MSSGMAMADLIADVHAHPWQMVPVPPDKWDWFTQLPSTGSVQMWTRSDLLADGDGWEGFDKWMELIGPNGTLEGYPVALKCECGAYSAYEVTYDLAYESDADGEEELMMQLNGLDEAMRPFVTEHNPHRWQGRLL